MGNFTKFFVFACIIRHQNGRFPWCRRQRKYFLSDVQDLSLNQEILHFRCCPPHHPSKIETCNGHVCLPTTPGCTAPYGHWWLNFSSVLCSSVTERLTTDHEVGGSNHRQTDGFKSEEKNWKKLKLWSVSCVVCLGRLIEDRCSTKMNSVLDMSFSVDSCVRKHAKVNGENRQPCFNVVYFR